MPDGTCFFNLGSLQSIYMARDLVCCPPSLMSTRITSTFASQVLISQLVYTLSCIVPARLHSVRIHKSVTSARS